jgi:hypothetical protein
MTSRRRRPPDSSLELLLDTITNTFGGILFLAILVSLLLQTSGSGDPRAAATRGAPLSAAEAADIEIRLEDLQDQARRLRKARSEHRVEGPDAAAVMQRVDDLTERLTRVLEEQSRAALATADLQRKATEADSEARRTAEESDRLREEHATAAAARRKDARDRAAKSDARHESARRDQQAAQAEAARLSQLEITLEDAAEPSVIEQTAGLPKLEPTFKRQVAIYVRFGRMFMMHVWHNGERLGPNPGQFIVVPGDPPVAYPKPATGLPIEKQTIQAEVAALRREFPPAAWAVAIIVFDDSFSEFQWLKKAIVENGFEYNPIPLKDGEYVYDSGGTAVAQ